MTAVIRQLALHPTPDAASEPFLIKVRGLKKSYGPTRALTGCSFDIAPGEIRAVLGENGSGKSTLVKILSGVLRCDEGEVLMGGTPVRFRSPREAQAAGIVTVFQETLAVPEQSVLDNIFLGTDRLFGWSLPRAGQRRQASELLDELGAGDTNLDAPVEALPLERRQIIAITRALARPWRLLILDEATSALDVGSRDALFAYLRQRPAEHAVMFISHRMDEIAAIADRVTFLQSGETTATLQIGNAPTEVLVSMISRSRDPDKKQAQARTSSGAFNSSLPGSPCLRARNTVLRAGARTVDLEIRSGEIIGFGGLDGHGQAEMLAALAGVRQPLAGDVSSREGSSWRPLTSPAQAVRQGVVYVPRERKTEGLFPNLSILDNYSVPTLRRWSRLTFIRRAALKRQAQVDLEGLKTRFASVSMPVSRLSGGNQQKVLLARWLAASPRVLVLNDPLRGVDAATKADIHGLFRDLAASGVAIALLSSEIEELLALCQTIVVFREGQVSRTLDCTTKSREAVVAAMFGQAAPEGNASTLEAVPCP